MIFSHYEVDGVVHSQGVIGMDVYKYAFVWHDDILGYAMIGPDITEGLIVSQEIDYVTSIPRDICQQYAWRKALCRLQIKTRGHLPYKFLENHLVVGLNLQN